MEASRIATSVVEAGGQQPLPARTKGYVEDIFFAEGEYAHAGQPLLKLSNQNFVIAPHSGFLGPCLVTTNQYLTSTTPVTTLSRRSYLLLPVARQLLRQAGLRPGDSLNVWAATGPARLVVGQVRQPLLSSAADSSWEVKLPLRAPLHLGERVNISRFSNSKHSSVAHAQPLSR